MSILFQWINKDEVYKIRYYNPVERKVYRIDKKGADLNYFEAEYILDQILESSSDKPYQEVVLNNHFKIYKN